MTYFKLLGTNEIRKATFTLGRAHESSAEREREKYYLHMVAYIYTHWQMTFFLFNKILTKCSPLK